MSPKVIVLGGGVAGMSAAHELAERGFRVEVFERRGTAGGKARSLPVFEPGANHRPSVSGTAFAGATPRRNKPWLPGEHGFRFFPRFYQHVVDTMARIPLPDGRNVAQNLVDTTRAQIARFGQASFFLPARFPQTTGDLQTILHAALGLLAGNMGISLEETMFFGAKMWQFLTSCEERRMTEYETLSWWHFIEAERASDAYKRYFGHGITRSLVAAKARRASAKTIGNIFTQMICDILRPGVSTDRVLNGPTNDVWIDPWLSHLENIGVVYHFDAVVTAINCAHGVVRSATISVGGRTMEVVGDYYIGAIPVERMAELLSPEMLSADRSLGNISKLKNAVEWMNGLQFYLTDDVPLVHGHTIYLDSPWALTSISQPQFWGDYDMTDYGDGKVKGIISVDISNWNTPGLNGKTARNCSRDEVASEVWNQLKLSLNVSGRQVLRDEQLHYWFLDADIVDADPSLAGLEVNLEPLLVNYVDTWQLRPEAITRIPNLFLASDYVRTFTDLATMEAANEAARRAVNGILNASHSTSPPCRLWNFHEPELLAPLRAHDRVRHRQQLPWDGQTTALAHSALSLSDQAKSLLQNYSGDAGAAAALVSLGKSSREVAGVAQTLAGIHMASLSDVPNPPVAPEEAVEAPEQANNAREPVDGGAVWPST